MPTAVTVHVGTRTHLSGLPTNQALLSSCSSTDKNHAPCRTQRTDVNSPFLFPPALRDVCSLLEPQRMRDRALFV